MTDDNSNSIDPADARKPRVVIVGGGSGGLAVAKALRKTPVHVVLFDRTNHHPIDSTYDEALMGQGQASRHALL